jgi:hypothetical protein
MWRKIVNLLHALNRGLYATFHKITDPRLYLPVILGTFVVLMSFRVLLWIETERENAKSFLGEIDEFLGKSINDTNKFLLETEDVSNQVLDNMLEAVDISFNAVVGLINSVGSIVRKSVNVPDWRPNIRPLDLSSFTIPVVPISFRTEGEKIIEEATAGLIVLSYTLIAIGSITLLYSVSSILITFFWGSIGKTKRKQLKRTKTYQLITRIITLLRLRILIPLLIFIGLLILTLTTLTYLPILRNNLESPLLQADAEIHTFVSNLNEFLQKVPDFFIEYLEAARKRINEASISGINEITDGIESLNDELAKISGLPTLTIPRFPGIFRSRIPNVGGILQIPTDFFSIHNLIFPVINNVITAIESACVFISSLTGGLLFILLLKTLLPIWLPEKFKRKFFLIFCGEVHFSPNIKSKVSFFENHTSKEVNEKGKRAGISKEMDAVKPNKMNIPRKSMSFGLLSLGERKKGVKLPEHNEQNNAREYWKKMEQV